MTKKYIIVADDSIKGFDEEIAKLERDWGAEEIELCEDCVSRAQALHACCDEWNKDYKAIMKSIRQLSSVKPKSDVLDKIIAEIKDEAEYAYADFDKYKEDILHAEPDELPDDDFRYGLRRAIEIINKYKRKSEDK